MVCTGWGLDAEEDVDDGWLMVVGLIVSTHSGAICITLYVTAIK